MDCQRGLYKRFAHGERDKTLNASTGNFNTKTVSINASGVTAGGVKVTLNNKNNYFIGSASGNSITDGSSGDDTISVSGAGADIFYYKGGADSIVGLGAGADIFYYKGGADSIVGLGAGDSIDLSQSKFKLVTDGSKLESLEGEGSKFKLTFDKNNLLTFSIASGAVSVYGSDGKHYEYTPTAISLKSGTSGEVTLGSSYNTTSFDGSAFSVISAAAVTAGGAAGFSIKGGDTGSDIYGSDKVFTSITGGKGNDTLKAGTVGAYLSGGESGNDLLVGNSGTDSFLYVSGADSIQNYTYDTDVVSISGTNVTIPMTFDTTKAAHAHYNGSDYVISLGAADSVLTFKATQQFELKTGTSGDSIYAFTPGSIALKSNGNNGITIGGGYYKSKTFNGASDDNSSFVSINASEVNHAIKVTGNDNPNYMIASSLYGGTLLGGNGKDTLQAGSVGAYMDGQDGDVLYIGNTGNLTDNKASLAKDTFVYRGNAASIQGYGAGDIVNFSARDITITSASISAESVGTNVYDLTLDFTGGNKIIFQSLGAGIATNSGASLKSGSDIYIYKKDNVTWNGKSITLTADYAGNSLYSAPHDTLLATIDAHLVGKSISGDTTVFSIAGNDNDNYIIGSASKANSIWGSKGDDTLVGSSNSGDVFRYTEGNDVIIGFDDKDKFDITSTLQDSIKSGKTSKNKLTFKIDKDNSIVFRAGDNTNVPEMVSLSGGGFLTASGIVSSITSDGHTNEYSLKLFSSAKGTIDLANYTLTGGQVTSVNAAAVTKQGLTIVGKSVTGTAYYNFYNGNKKRDTFEYDAGKVSISGFESGKDRLNIAEESITSFSIHGGTNGKGGDVIISLNGGAKDVISLSGAQGNEILVRANGARGYSKMVFAETGVLGNKAKNPTSVTLSTGAASYSAVDTVKKITVTDIKNAVSIYAGAKGSVIDASDTLVGAGVSIIGGAKNDNFTGSAHTDTFIFNTSNGGKDIFNGFVGAGNSDADSIEFSNGGASLLSNAKITASNKAVKFKFGKNMLTLKDDSIKGAQLQIDGTSYSYDKNAIISSDGKTASLTSEFGGTYKIADDISKVDGSLVKKNLTFKAIKSGTDETLVGGTKKTTFKGAGGADSLVGGSGDDIFFYAKGDNGTATISSFDVENDKLKIAGGTLRKIETVSGGGITFGMSAKNSKDDPEIGHFQIQSFYNKSNSSNPTIISEDTAKKTFIHANNTYYWFAQEDVKAEVTTEGGDGTTVTVVAGTGNLITWSDKKVSKSDVSGHNVIELNYGTNLVKSGVATLVSSKDSGATLPST